MTPSPRPVLCLVAASLVLVGLSSPALAEVPALRCATASRPFTSEPADQVVPEATGRDFTIAVGGMGPIADIDVYVDLESSRPGDLEITLLPPVNTFGGSGVVLTRGNGGIVVDAFSDITWDDQATAAGGGAITDLDFTTFTGDRVPPQTPLSRLIGFEANGTWTLRVRDLSANGTTTRLRSWRLVVTSASRSPRDPETTRTHTFASGTTSVPALGTAFLDITVPLTPLLERIVDVRVTTSLFHPDSGQYDVVLRRLGTDEQVTLSTDNGNGVSNGLADVRWTDAGTPVTLTTLTFRMGARDLAPEEPLASLVGIDPRGTWRLEVTDDTAGTAGSPFSWSLEIVTSACADVRPSVEGESTTTGPVNDTLATASPLAPIAGRLAQAFGEVRATNASTTDVDYWYVDVPAGARIWALAEVAPRFAGLVGGGQPSTRLRLLSTTGQVLATDEADGVTRQLGGAFGAIQPSPSISGHPLATAARYYLQLEALPGVASVSYQLFVVVMTAPAVTSVTPALANYDRPIATVEGTTADGSDAYSVSGLVPGSLVLLSVDGDPDRLGSSSNPTLTVQRGPGLPVLQALAAASAPNANALIVEPGGTAFSVTVASGGTTGGYALTATIIRGPNADLQIVSPPPVSAAQDGLLQVSHQVRTDGFELPYVLDVALQAPLRFAFASPNGFPLGCSTPAQGATGTISCSDAESRGVVPANTTLGSLFLRSTVPPGVAGPVSQVATVRLTDPGTSTPMPLDYDTDDNTFTVLYPLSSPAADVFLTTFASNTGTDVALPGQALSFQTNISNAGPSTARNVVQTCSVAAPGEMVSAQGFTGDVVCLSPVPQQGGGSTVSCTIAALGPNQVAGVVLQGRVRPDATAPLVGQFACSVTSLTADPGSANNTATTRFAALVSPSPTDTDGDGLTNEYETRFGLDPDDPSGAEGAAGDPDGDGIVSLDEQAAGTHPRGSFRRFFAEGSTGAFFDTRLALLHPLARSQPAIVQVRYLRPAPLPAIVETFELPAQQRRTVALDAIPGLESTAVSIVVESDQNVVADRTMSWDDRGYGSHGETGVAAPGTSWHLAEGSTKGGFNLFYLLQNPNSEEAVVTVRYLRPAPLPVVQRTYTVGPNARFNIWVNLEGPEFTATDVSAAISATRPIIVERAMYLDVAGQRFGAGHAGMGARALSTVWNLAEGATGAFFDLFVLLANPSGTAADVRLTYLKPDGTTITRTRTLAPNSRDTVWVDFEDPALADTAVSTQVLVTNGVGIAVERAMWWPGSSSTWHEAHVSLGATTSGRVWAVAEGQVGGATRDEDTYLLVANVSDVAGQAEVTLYFEDGTSAVKTFTMLPRSRLNVHVRTEFPGAIGRRFGSVVRSRTPDGTATGPAIIVEQAMYWNVGMQIFAAGSNMLATRVQ